VFDALQRRPAIHGFDDLVAVLLERLAVEQSLILVVFDKQNPRHGCILPWRPMAGVLFVSP